MQRSDTHIQDPKDAQDAPKPAPSPARQTFDDWAAF